MKSLSQITLLLATAMTLQGGAPAVSTNAPTNAVRVAIAPVSQALPPNVNEVIRLAESGMDESIVLAFIESAPMPFELSADQVIYLNDIGISSPVLAAMLHHDSVLREQQIEIGIATNVVPQTVSTSNAPTVSVAVYVTNAPAQVTYFYDALASYGTWIELEGSGWCWQPRVAVIDTAWRPYWQGGRWIYSDLGWYWYSDYTWGWAPFHYGRWHLHPHHGWVWFPDLVWGPAWVSWRYSDVYCGWAPLPPGSYWMAGSGFYYNGVSVGIGFDFYLGINCWTFVEIGHCHDHHPHHHGVHHDHHHNVYRNTTVVNNYAVGRNNSVINHGVPVGRVATASRREINPVQVRETRAESGAAGRLERLDRTGSTPTLYRPQLQAPARPPSAVAQRVSQQQPIVRSPARPPAGAPPRHERTTVAQPATPAPRSPVRPPTQAQPSQPRTQPAVPRTQTTPSYPGTQPRVAPATPRPQSVPARPVSPAESPRAREQRLSNGHTMQRATPHQAPHAQPHGYSQPSRGTRGSRTH